MAAESNSCYSPVGNVVWQCRVEDEEVLDVGRHPGAAAGPVLLDIRDHSVSPDPHGSQFVAAPACVDQENLGLSYEA